jgi:hypothetical protein
VAWATKAWYLNESGLEQLEKAKEMGVLRALVVGVLLLWLGQAFGLSRVMSGRGFHPLPWLALGFLLGPAVWPLALMEALSGPPSPELVVRCGRSRPAGVDAFAPFDGDEFPDTLARELKRLNPHCRRLVLGRVVKAGGQVFIEREAEAFLERVARRIGPRWGRVADPLRRHAPSGGSDP